MMFLTENKAYLLRKGKNIYKMFTEKQIKLIKKAVDQAIDNKQFHGCAIIWDPEHRGGIAANYILIDGQVHIMACFITEKEFEAHMKSL